MDSLTREQVAALDEMVARRMENTGESRDESCLHITNYLKDLLDEQHYL